MTAYKSYVRAIKDGLVTLLQGITLDTGTGAEPAFQLVTDDPSKEFDQEPFALVYPAPSDDVKSAVGQQDRTHSFVVAIVLSLKGTDRTQPETYNYMYDLTELVLDSLDEADWKDTLHTQDATIAPWIINATKNSFMPADSKGGPILLCTIDVAVSYTKDL